jgi:enediyne biosynthesis protein E4
MPALVLTFFRMTFFSRALYAFIFVGFVMIGGCGRNSESIETLPGTQPPISASPESSMGVTDNFAQTRDRIATPLQSPIRFPFFSETHQESSLDFQFDAGANGRALMFESTGGGGGWIDFDRDGQFDFYCPQGGNPTPEPGEEPASSRNRLFRNCSGIFADVSLLAHVADAGYGQGLAVGDFDNDGFQDLYVTNVGDNVLYRNLGDGSFENVTIGTDTGDPNWGTSAAWGDLDGDGDLDLFVCNYIKYDRYAPPPCQDKFGRPAVCHPEDLDAAENVVFRNDGDGRFTSAGQEWGLFGENGKSLGVAIADMNGDDLPDVFVANDTTANFLFVNRGSGQFEEVAAIMGCAISGLGQYQASMGIAFGDYDRNGFPDLYVTHFTDDSNTLYANLGPAGFYDATRQSGLHVATLEYLAFGAVMADFNADGNEDLIIANGHIDDWRDRGELLEMPCQIFSFDGQQWLEAGGTSGEYFNSRRIGRSVSSSDFDLDGDLDLAIVNQGNDAALLRNDRLDGHWLKVRLIGRHFNRDGTGAKVTVRQNETKLVQHLAGGTSYCSAHEPVLFFGLADRESDCTVSVQWSSGQIQQLDSVRIDQSLTIIETHSNAVVSSSRQ